MQTYNVGAPLERVALDILGPLPESDRGNKYILGISSLVGGTGHPVM